MLTSIWRLLLLLLLLLLSSHLVAACIVLTANATAHARGQPKQFLPHVLSQLVHGVARARHKAGNSASPTRVRVYMGQ